MPLAAGRPVALQGGIPAQTLHRIDEAFVTGDVEAFGLQHTARPDASRNPGDDRSLHLFDPNIRGSTDRFILVLRKPQ